LQSDDGWFSGLIFLTPYLLAIATLIVAGQWKVYGVMSVIVHAQGSHALDIGNFTSFTGSAKLIVMTQKVYSWWSMLLNISGILIVGTLIVYIVYNTIYYRKYIFQYYGKIQNPKAKWYITLTTVIEKNYILWHETHIITITIPSQVRTNNESYCVDQISTWIMKDKLELIQPLQIHSQSVMGNPINNEAVRLDLHDVNWNYRSKPKELNELHGQIVHISFHKLVHKEIETIEEEVEL